MDFVPDPRSPEDFAKFMERATGYVEISTSPLVRVIGIGQQAEDAGIRVEMIAIEVRQLGAILYWKAYRLQEGPVGDAQISVSDDQGRSYDVSPMSSEGGDYQWKGETSISPSPAPNVRRLQVEITAFEGFGHGFPGAPSTPAVVGHWAFELDLVS
jgi:hypothetical protein